MEVKLSIRGSLFLILMLFSAAYLSATPYEIPEPVSPEEPAGQTLLDHELLLRVLLGDRVEEMPMDEYLTGVLRAEMPASFEMEALKAQVVAARSYTLHKMRQGAIENHPQADTCDDIGCCKAYATAAQAAAGWGQAAEGYEHKLQEAVAATDGLVAAYRGTPILAVFHSSAPGQTQNAEEVWQTRVPYLQSVQSPEGAQTVPDYYSTVRIAPQQARTLLEKARPGIRLSENPSDWVTQVQTNPQSLITSLTIGGETFTGGEVRGLFDLRSACFTVTGDEAGLHFSVIAYGHGVGMSQYGANELARQGMNFREILAWYYTGTTVESYWEN